MISIKNVNTGRVVHASRRMLSSLGPNWVEVSSSKRLAPKKEPKIEYKKETPVAQAEGELPSEKEMRQYLKEKGHKGAHLYKLENVIKNYENQKQEDQEGD